MVDDLIRYKQIIEQSVEEQDDIPVAKPLIGDYRDLRNFNVYRFKLSALQRTTDILWIKYLSLNLYGMNWQRSGSFRIPGGNFISKFNLIVPKSYLEKRITHPPLELFANVEYCYEGNDHPYKQKEFSDAINRILKEMGFPNPDCTFAPAARQQECMLVLRQEALTQTILDVWQKITNPVD